VGILDEDEWYVVSLRRADSGTEPAPLEWTKATSWRLPADLYEAGQPEPLQFRWQVSVMRQTGVAEDGIWIGEEQSPNSEIRTFSWK
jgi:hypothetical protein